MAILLGRCMVVGMVMVRMGRPQPTPAHQATREKMNAWTRRLVAG